MLSSVRSALGDSCFFLSGQEVEARSDLSYHNFSQLYRTLMFDAQRSVRSQVLPEYILYILYRYDIPRAVAYIYMHLFVTVTQ